MTDANGDMPELDIASIEAYLQAETTPDEESSEFDPAINDIPLGRAGLPSDQASMALFLATEESSWMTGQILTVDGGHSIALSLTQEAHFSE